MFVSLRVLVHPGESRAAALHRTVERIPFPLTMANRHKDGQIYVANEAAIPLVDTQPYPDTWLIKYE